MKYIFLSYLNRSGSTFLINQLSKVPQICVCPEADILYDLLLTKPDMKIKKYHLKKWKPLLKSDRKIKIWKINVEEILSKQYPGKKNYELFLQILNGFQKKHYPKSSYILFKHNYIHKLINREIFDPSVRIYWFILQRELPAIYSSQKLTVDPHTGKSMCKNPLWLAQTRKSVFRTTEHELHEKKNRLFIQFEKMISNHIPEMNRILSFIGIKDSFTIYLGQAFRHSDWIDPFYKSLHPNVEKSPITERINAWRNKISVYDQYILQKYSMKNKINASEYSNHINHTVLLRKLIYFYFDMKIKSIIQKARKLFFRFRYLIF